MHVVGRPCLCLQVDIALPVSPRATYHVTLILLVLSPELLLLRSILVDVFSITLYPCVAGQCPHPFLQDQNQQYVAFCEIFELA